MGYWLNEWIDEAGIRTAQQARLALRTKTGRRQLVDSAHGGEEIEEIGRGAAHRLLAGHTMDLSGNLNCSDPECLKKQVNELIVRTWHYFDEVVVNGLNSDRVRDVSIKSNLDPNLERSIVDQVNVALHVRHLGVEDGIRFVDKPFRCPEHIRKYAEDGGYHGDIESMTQRLTDEFSKTSKVLERRRVKGGRVRYAYTNDSIDIVHTGTIDARPGISKKELGELLAAKIANEYAGARVTDSLFAKKIYAALGDATADRDLSRQDPLRPGDVAFNLQLPMITSIPIAEVLKIRADHFSEYQALRAALRKGIEECIKALPDQTADVVADSVYEDVIEPEVVRLQRKLDTALSAAAKRYSAVAAVGSIITTVGLSAFAPLTVTGVAVAAGATFATYFDWLKDRKEVAMSDLHFLLRLEKSSVGHAG